ncbi:hypothetical protein [Ferviditalea candida]|uniref:Uncharacterized protein n=1 Tax=Ferviditalea candida TaxID=3108399 RepID=A0ABU5ZMQ5_9BACL|nr:hypothetical protein [Paenibacillaceae bacterium T2]
MREPDQREDRPPQVGRGMVIGLLAGLVLWAVIYAIWALFR